MASQWVHSDISTDKETPVNIALRPCLTCGIETANGENGGKELGNGDRYCETCFATRPRIVIPQIRRNA